MQSQLRSCLISALILTACVEATPLSARDNGGRTGNTYGGTRLYVRQAGDAPNVTLKPLWHNTIVNARDYYPKGYTIVCEAPGAARANITENGPMGEFTKSEYYNPFTIAGDSNGIFNQWRPYHNYFPAEKKAKVRIKCIPYDSNQKRMKSITIDVQFTCLYGANNSDIDTNEPCHQEIPQPFSC